MRSVVALAAAAVAAAVAAPAAGAGGAGSTESSTASCLRARWSAGAAESARVLQSLAPGPYRVAGQLFIVFDGRLMLYGTTQMRLSLDLGGSMISADARFESQAPYRVRTPGRLNLGAGTSVVTYESFTAVKNGRRATVPGPPDSTRAVPAGPWPYQCSATRLRLKLPAFASSGWITFRKRR